MNNMEHPESQWHRTPSHVNSQYSRGQWTPPETPEDVDAKAQAPDFQPFLRAFFPYQPGHDGDSSTVTLPLQSGDVVLVHSIHDNGWADGTLIASGSRGWLPTNYCEAYGGDAMDNLLHALTVFWDLVKGSSDGNLAVFSTSDYARGLVGGVRSLLESTGCLSRDCSMLVANTTLRRYRKAMLSELSSFVKMTKSIQALLADSARPTEFPDAQLENLVLRAFKTVLRAVRYLDVWESGMQNLLGEAPMTPPQNHLFEDPQSHGPPNLNDTSIPAFEGLDCHFSPTEKITKPAPLLCKSLPQTPLDSTSPTLRPSSGQVSHRVSCLVSSSQNMASGKLGTMHETFLSHLASFVNLHVHSRTSFEVLHTTMQACFACRSLLDLVNEVWERDCRRSPSLALARDDMYRRIATLASAARDVVRCLRAEEDEGIPLGGDQPLVDAARSCIRTAGKCTDECRAVFDRTGDFQYDVSDDPPLVVPTSSYSDQTLLHVPSPPAAFLQTKSPHDQSSAPTESSGKAKHSAERGRFFHKKKAPSLTLVDSSVEEPLSSSGQSSQTASLRKWRVRRNSGHRRDSEHSSVSQTSTRATSPDITWKVETPRNISFTNSSIDSGHFDPEADDLEASLQEPTFAHELVYNKCGEVVGGSLPALVERLTSADTLPSAPFVSTFFLTFRRFATPTEFAQALSHRYDWANECPRIAATVRLRVYNVFKNWLELYWRPESDGIALDVIRTFTTHQLQQAIPTAAQRLHTAMAHLSKLPVPAPMERTYTSLPQRSSLDTPSPAPALSKSQYSALRSWNVGVSPLSLMELDPLEVARQITLRESRIFRAIAPHELLGCEWTKQNDCQATNVRALTRFSTDLSNAVASSILQVDDVKKRAVTIKQWSKVAERLLELGNFHSFMAMVCALTQSSITRLKRTWDCVSVKTKQRLERFKKIIACERNFAALRQTVQQHDGAGIPCVGLYLTDLNFIEDGNPDTRHLGPSKGSPGQERAVINFDKHMKTARIVEEIQRFQVPYNLSEVGELQAWLQEQLWHVQGRDQASMVKDLYQRSLALEPRMVKIDTGGGRERLDKFLGNRGHAAASSVSGG